MSVTSNNVKTNNLPNYNSLAYLSDKHSEKIQEEKNNANMISKHINLVESNNIANLHISADHCFSITESSVGDETFFQPPYMGDSSQVYAEDIIERLPDFAYQCAVATTKAITDFVQICDDSASVIPTITSPDLSEDNCSESINANPSRNKTSSGGSAAANGFDYLFHNALIALMRFMNITLSPKQIAALGQSSANTLNLVLSYVDLVSLQGDSVVKYMNIAKDKVNLASWVSFGGAGFNLLATTSGAVFSYQGQMKMLNANTNIDLAEMETKVQIGKDSIGSFKNNIASNYTEDELTMLRENYDELDPRDSIKSKKIQNFNQEIRDELLSGKAILELKADPIGKSAKVFKEIQKGAVDCKLQDVNGNYNDKAMSEMLTDYFSDSEAYKRLSSSKFSREELHQIPEFNSLPDELKDKVNSNLFIRQENNQTFNDEMLLINEFTDGEGKTRVLFFDKDVNDKCYLREITHDIHNDQYSYQSYPFGESSSAKLNEFIVNRQESNIYFTKNIKAFNLIKKHNNQLLSSSQEQREILNQSKTDHEHDLANLKQEISAVHDQAATISMDIKLYKQLQQRELSEHHLISNDPLSFDGADMDIEAVKRQIINSGYLPEAEFEKLFGGTQLDYLYRGNFDGNEYSVSATNGVVFDCSIENVPQVKALQSQIDALNSRLHSGEFDVLSGIDHTRQLQIDDYAQRLVSVNRQCANLDDHFNALQPLSPGNQAKFEAPGKFYEAIHNYKKQMEKGGQFNIATAMAIGAVGGFVEKGMDIEGNRLQIESQQVQRVGEASSNLYQGMSSGVESLMRDILQGIQQISNIVLQSIQEQMTAMTRSAASR